MSRAKKKILAGLVFGVMVTSSILRAADVLVTVPITAGTVTISAPTSFSFGATSVSFQAQTISQLFTGVTNYFTVSDLKGNNSGYNTTLQMAGNLTTGGNSISSSNVAFKSSGSVAQLLSGNANPRVLIDSNAAGGFQSLNSARTFIYRDAGLNTGVLSMYYQSIEMQITVPAAQPAGSYTGTLVYTLIEN